MGREYYNQTNKKFEFSNWKISNEKVSSFINDLNQILFILVKFKNIPKQNRNKDCGVFMLFYAKCLATGQELNNFSTVCNNLMENLFKNNID